MFKLTEHNGTRPPSVNAPLVFHDEPDRVLDLQVLRRAAPLLLGRCRVFLVLDVFQCVLDQVAHSPVLGRV